MKSNFPSILTPEMTEGIKGFNLCAFLIGLEGWRRGLTLKYYVDINQHSNIKTQGKKLIGRNYSLESKNKVHYFNQSRGDLVGNETVKIVQSKQKTKDYLKNNNISIMPSIEFNGSHLDEEIIKRALEVGFPVVIKPTYGSLSKGVMLNIQDESGLMKALKHVRSHLGYKNVILEKYFEGDDIRLYVINGVVVAALRRTPAQITGDGFNTIKELINQKNESRKGNPYLEARPIKIDEEVKIVLKKNNYELNNILERGKTILVKNKSTMDQGVDLYDITEEVQDHVKKLAVNTLASFPNIIHGSIDMLYDGYKAIVLEVNASANISMHMFPTEGKPRNIGAFLMDYYFPETKVKAEAHTNMYFDYLHVINILKRNYTNYIEISPLPDAPIMAMQYFITGKVQKVGYRKWIRRQAILKNLNGFTKNLSDGSVEVIVAGSDAEIVRDFQHVCAKGSKRAKVTDVKSYHWNKEIKSGFELVLDSDIK